MELVLKRVAYTRTETQGVLWAGSQAFETIERPWVRGPHPGGQSFESCIPDGEYELRPHNRPDGAKVVALINPDLGVWYMKEDRPDVWGRFLILIHAGNFVRDIVGCIAPGLSRTIHNNEVMVTSSRAAMKKLDVQQYDSIIIKPTEGAKDGP